jgi:hypothetical protein
MCARCLCVRVHVCRALLARHVCVLRACGPAEQAGAQLVRFTSSACLWQTRTPPRAVRRAVALVWVVAVVAVVAVVWVVCGPCRYHRSFLMTAWLTCPHWRAAVRAGRSSSWCPRGLCCAAAQACPQAAEPAQRSSSSRSSRGCTHSAASTAAQLSLGRTVFLFFGADVCVVAVAGGWSRLPRTARHSQAAAGVLARVLGASSCDPGACVDARDVSGGDARAHAHTHRQAAAEMPWALARLVSLVCASRWCWLQHTAVFVLCPRPSACCCCGASSFVVAVAALVACVTPRSLVLAVLCACLALCVCRPRCLPGCASLTHSLTHGWWRAGLPLASCPLSRVSLFVVWRRRRRVMHCPCDTPLLCAHSDRRARSAQAVSEPWNQPRDDGRRGGCGRDAHRAAAPASHHPASAGACVLEQVALCAALIIISKHHRGVSQGAIV